MTTTQQPPRRPRTGGIGLALPASWWTIDLHDADSRRRSIAALVERQVGRADERAALRADLRTELGTAADQAATSGGLLMAVSLMEAAGIPVPASVTLYRLPGGDLTSTGVVELEQALRADLAEDVTLDLADGPAGPVLRRVARRPGPTSLGADRITQLIVDYWLDPGDDLGLAYLSFSSPLADLADGLLTLFDAITATVVAEEPDDDAEDGVDGSGVAGGSIGISGDGDVA